MSHILFQNENTQVIWSITKYQTLADNKTNYWIKLMITLFINWKLKTFTHDFAIQKWECHDFELVDYTHWYSIHNILWDLWYKIKEEWSDSKESTYSWNIINKFIYQITRDLNI